MTPTNSDNRVIERPDLLEARTAHLETAMRNALTFEILVARLVGTPDTKKERKTRPKRVLTPEEKAAFHDRMIAVKLANEKFRNASKK